MNPIVSYQQQPAPTWPRIDALLALFDAAIERTAQTLDALGGPDPIAAAILRTKARLLVLGLWSGVDIQRGELATNLVKLYEFAAYALAEGTEKEIRAALSVLQTIRDGYGGIRDEAVALENDGAIPPLDGVCAVHALA